MQSTSPLGTIIGNVLPGRSVSSASSFLNDGRAPSVASTAKPNAVQFVEKVQNSEEDKAEDNFADLAAIPILADDDQDDLEVDNFPFPVPQSGIPPVVASMPPAASSPPSTPVPVRTTTRKTDSPVTAAPPTPKTITNTQPSVLYTPKMKPEVPTRPPFASVTPLPVLLTSTGRYQELPPSIPVKSARVQASVSGNGQQYVPNLTVTDFQNLTQLLAGLVASLREGVGDSGTPHVFNINIGTINWNYGHNPHVIYGGQAEPASLATVSPGQQGASDVTINLPASNHSEETPRPDVTIPSRSPTFQDSQFYQSTTVKTTPALTTTTTTESPDIDPRQPPKPSLIFHPKKSQSAFEAMSVISNSNKLPDPLLPVDEDELYSHESVVSVTFQPPTVNSTESKNLN